MCLVRLCLCDGLQIGIRASLSDLVLHLLALEVLLVGLFVTSGSYLVLAEDFGNFLAVFKKLGQ